MIWTTELQQPILFDDLRKKLFPYMKEFCAKQKIKIDCLNGHAEHVHCLFPVSLETDLKRTIHSIQQDSAHWILLRKIQNSNGMKVLLPFQWGNLQ